MVDTFKQFLEKRSNSELNPKLSAYEQLKPYANKDDYYISFTEIDKLGINPRSGYKDTPLGIYGYPLKEVWKEYNIEQNRGFDDIPYSGESPYIWLFRPNK